MSVMASRTDRRSRMSTACQQMEPSVEPGELPGRYHATSGVARRASRSSRWLPANPAAPVTSVGRDIEDRSARHPAQATIEGREIAQASQRERQEKAVVGWHTDGCQSLKIVLLILECETAALRVIERRDALLDESFVEQVVIERVISAVLVRERMRVGRKIDGAVELRRVVEASELRNEEFLAPGR